MANDHLLDGSSDTHLSENRKIRKTPNELVRGYWIELSAVILLLVGVFLLLERLQIKLAVYKFLVLCVNAIGNAARAIWDWLVHTAFNVEQSDIVGVVLVVVGLSIIVYRTRLRAIAKHPEIDLLEECPECGEELGLLKRTRRVRLAEMLLLVRIRQYRCTNCSFYHSVWQSRRPS
jgi:hypothetical protein